MRTYENNFIVHFFSGYDLYRVNIDHENNIYSQQKYSGFVDEDSTLSDGGLINMAAYQGWGYPILSYG